MDRLFFLRSSSTSLNAFLYLCLFACYGKSSGASQGQNVGKFKKGLDFFRLWRYNIVGNSFGGLDMPTFVDMFAGAGGFSEGFLQAEESGRHFDFLLASDINSTCEVTHRMRYNHQHGLNAEL